MRVAVPALHCVRSEFRARDAGPTCDFPANDLTHLFPLQVRFSKHGCTANVRIDYGEEACTQPMLLNMIAMPVVVWSVVLRLSASVARIFFVWINLKNSSTTANTADTAKIFREALKYSSPRRKPGSSSLNFLDSGVRRNDESAIDQRFPS